MILDKTSINSILCTNQDELELKRKNNEDGIYIRTNTETNMFCLDQIGNDSIDLRIANYGYVMRSGYNYINTLSFDKFDKYFEKIQLENKGYILKPGQLIFVPTLERIALTGSLIGRITGRSVFARMGLSVHCTQDKFSSGINSVAGLQIMNNSPVPLKIFPMQKLAQILIEKTGDNRHPYTGTFSNEIDYELPCVKSTDRDQYDQLTKENIKKDTPKRVKTLKDKTVLSLTISQLIIPIVATALMGIFGIFKNPIGVIAIGVFQSVSIILITIIGYNWQKEKEKGYEED